MQHRPKWFKDVVKSNLKALEIDVDNWENLVKSFANWGKLIQN